jgi:hypothetical protein
MGDAPLTEAPVVEESMSDAPLTESPIAGEAMSDTPLIGATGLEETMADAPKVQGPADDAGSEHSFNSLFDERPDETLEEAHAKQAQEGPEKGEAQQTEGEKETEDKKRWGLDDRK